MELFQRENQEFLSFVEQTNEIIDVINKYSKDDCVDRLLKINENFQYKISDFYRENRKLNIGVVGQVKAGKSSFLNSLLFDGKEILPKASTPKTATLTKMEYSEENAICIEYYSLEEWEVLEENALVELDDEIYSSAREIVEMVKKNGIDPKQFLEKGI